MKMFPDIYGKERSTGRCKLKGGYKKNPFLAYRAIAGAKS